MRRRRTLAARAVACGATLVHPASKLAGGTSPREGSSASTGAPAPVSVGRAERLLVVAPHPDDETIGAGGLIQRVRAQGGTVRILLVTAGDGYVEAVAHETGEPRPRAAEYIAYGERRLREARAAMRRLDGTQLRLQFLGFPDGGLDGLLRAHWLRTNPERSRTTGASDPPYDGEALEPDVPYDGADLRRELLNVIRETEPTIVAFPDPLDVHPDHRATGVFALLALDDYARDPHRSMPRLLAYLVHWPDWPPGGDAKEVAPGASNEPLVLPGDLPRRGLGPVSLALSDAEIDAKRAALARYASQQQVMPELLAAFVRRSEPFTRLTEADLRTAGPLIPSATPADRPTPAATPAPSPGRLPPVS